MDFSTKAFNTKNAIAQHKTGCAVVAVYENGKLSTQAKALDDKGFISAAIKGGDISGKAGSTLLLQRPGASIQRVLLVGLGSDDNVTDRNFSAASQAIARVLATLGANDALLALPLDGVKGRDTEWALRAQVIALRESVFRADGLKSKKDESKTGVRKIAFAVDTAAQAAAKTAVAQAVALANGMDLTKTLGNLPPNICTPTYLATTAKQLAKDHKFGVEVLDRKQLEASPRDI